MNIQRYDIVGYESKTPSEDGDWVYYKDVDIIPELLELLREFLLHASVTEHMSAFVIERARAAIAKAEGK